MKKGGYISIEGTSFYDTRVIASPKEIMAISKKFDSEFYEQNDGKDKTNYCFIFKTEKDDVFTVYDYKYDRPLDDDELIDWHIGTKNKAISYDAKHELFSEILRIREEYGQKHNYFNN